MPSRSTLPVLPTRRRSMAALFAVAAIGSVFALGAGNFITFYLLCGIAERTFLAFDTKSGNHYFFEITTAHVDTQIAKVVIAGEPDFCGCHSDGGDFQYIAGTGTNRKGTIGSGCNTC